MSLRQKLALGFGGLLAIIAAMGIHNVTRITALGESIDVILRENYRSVIACQDMKEALERMDSGAVFVLLGAEEKGNEQIARQEAAFDNALRVELNNITLRGEGERARRLSDLFGRYRAAIRIMRDPAVGREARRRAYFAELLPLFQQIKDEAGEIQRMNQQNMVAMDVRARGQAALIRRQMYLMLFASTAVAAVFLFLTGKWILHPITRLKRSADEIRKGNLDLVLPAASRDEIGQLSAAFNEMATGLREFRRSNRARLLRVERSMAHAFDSLPDAVAVLGTDGRVELATPSAREAFGLKPGLGARDVPDPWMGELAESALRKGIPAEPEGQYAVVQRFVRNEEMFFRPKAVPILDSSREPAGVVLVFEDVTQQYRRDEARSGAIATVSHQLKTPLTSVRMAMHLLLEEKVGRLTEKQAELLVAAREDADRLDRILEDLLDISRMESGKVPIEYRSADPILLVGEAAKSFRSAARDRGVILRVDLPARLPEVRVDAARIGHVFENLLSNALKYTPAGGEVVLSAAAEPEVVRFRVADTGSGIPQRYLSRVFDPFFRVPDRDAEPGAGLGLAIAKEIVEAHGGTVRAESREGEGSVFEFTLRRADHAPMEGVRT